MGRLLVFLSLSYPSLTSLYSNLFEVPEVKQAGSVGKVQHQLSAGHNCLPVVLMKYMVHYGVNQSKNN